MNNSILRIVLLPYCIATLNINIVGHSTPMK